MTTQEKLIAAMQAAFPGESQAALARRAGLGVQRFNNYCTGIRTMDVDAVIGCAQVLGWDVRATVAQHEIETAPTPRVKALWKAFGTAAVLLAAGVLGSLPAPAQAAPAAFDGAPTVHYAKCRGWVRYTARLLSLFLIADDCLRGNAPSPADIRPVADQHSPEFRISTNKTPGRRNNR